MNAVGSRGKIFVASPDHIPAFIIRESPTPMCNWSLPSEMIPPYLNDHENLYWNGFLSRPRVISRCWVRTYTFPRSVINHLRRQRNVEPCKHAFARVLPNTTIPSHWNEPFQKCSKSNSREDNKTRPSYHAPLFFTAFATSSKQAAIISHITASVLYVNICILSIECVWHYQYAGKGFTIHRADKIGAAG